MWEFLLFTLIRGSSLPRRWKKFCSKYRRLLFVVQACNRRMYGVVNWTLDENPNTKYIEVYQMTVQCTWEIDIFKPLATFLHTFAMFEVERGLKVSVTNLPSTKVFWIFTNYLSGGPIMVSEALLKTKPGHLFGFNILNTFCGFWIKLFLQCLIFDYWLKQTCLVWQFHLTDAKI